MTLLIVLEGGEEARMLSVFLDDCFRYTGARGGVAKLLLSDHAVRYIFFMRLGVLGRIMRKHLSTKYGINLGDGSNIGAGCYLGHAYGINVNPGAVVGKNCNLHKGVTIGKENRGSRKGCPALGDRVWVGVNATIVGRVTIGDDVLIAPGSFVNRDIPSHSVVYGNPCVVVPRDCATEGYVENCI